MTGLTRRQALASFAAVGAAVAAAACGPSAPSAAPTTGQAGGTPKSGGELRIFGAQVIDWDPAKSSTALSDTRNSLVYEGLTEIKPDGSLVPLLAESWTTSADGKSITFKLRSGVKFHNGKTMTADDVAYTFARIKDPKATYVRARAYTVITGVTAADANTAVMTLSQPYPAIYGLIAAVVIHPKDAAAELNADPVGTGPFKKSVFDLPNQATLVKHTEYWRTGRPYLDKITLMSSTDATSALAAFRAGQADLIYRPQVADYDVVSRDTRFVTYGSDVYQGFVTEMILNPGRFAPFKDVRVRQAIFNALDRQALAQGALPGLAVPTFAAFYPSSHWAALKDPVYSKPDIAKAKQLLADAGYASGLRFEILTTPSVAHFVLATQLVSEQLKAIGITTTIKSPPPGGANIALTGEFDAYVAGSSASPEPDLAFAGYAFKDGTMNWGGTSEDPEVTALLRKALTLSSQAERLPVYLDAQRLMLRNGHIAFLYDYRTVDLAYPYVKGYSHWGVSARWGAMQNVWLDK